MTRPLIFVVGDLLLDHYVEGYASHISPEAPTPVFVEEQRYTRPGGAWNVAANCIAGGARVCYFGVDGISQIRDQVGSEVFPEKTCFIIQDEARTTQIKTRFIGQYGQQMLRSDTPKDDEISEEHAKALYNLICEVKNAEGVPDIILVSDYGCGNVTAELMRLLVGAFPSILIVDPYPTTDPRIYRGANILKMNDSEYGHMRSKLHECTVQELAEIVIITDKSEPVTVIDAEEIFEVPVPQRELMDACGAGDAFVAYLAISLGQEMGLEEAVNIAVHAGACAISHRGVHVVTRAEIDASVAME